MKIHKGDTVQIMTGKDRNKSGKVLKIDPRAGVVLVEGLNLVKKHVRPKKQGEKGQVINLPRPLNISKVMILCPSCGKPARVGFKQSGDKKDRYCKKCQAIL